MKKSILAQALATLVAPFVAHSKVYMERENFRLRSVSGPRSPQGVPVPVFIDTGVTMRDPATHPFGKAAGYPDYVMWHVDESDFDTYVAGDWVVTNTGAATEALAAGDGGRILFTNTALAADIAQLQRKVANFRLVGKLFSGPGVPAFFGGKLMVDSAANGDMVCGLQKASVNAFTNTDGIWFEKIAGAAVSFQVKIGGVATTVAGIANMVDATMMSFEWCYDGNAIWYGVNGVVLGSVSDVNLPTTLDLAPVIALRNNTAVARTLTADYFTAGKFRG